LRVLGIFVQKGGPDEGVARLWQGIMKELILQNKGVNEQFWSVFGVIFLKQLPAKGAEKIPPGQACAFLERISRHLRKIGAGTFSAIQRHNVKNKLKKEKIMVRKAIFLTSVTVAIILSTGCAPRQFQVSPPEQVNLVVSDNGENVRLFAGQELIIQLDGNPTTGYTWETKDLDTNMFMQVGDARFTSSDPKLVGSGGTQTLTLKVLNAGTSTLTLIYHRPWEKDVKPAKTFTVTVTVK
jgi:inhibitor of cysteine peptidase